jgi:hypothetical protein
MQLLIAGNTTHKLFKLPVEDGSAPQHVQHPTPVTRSSLLGKDLCQAHVIIVDEVSMLELELFSIIDNTLQTLTGRKGVPFGGKILVLSGDFQQASPVLK